jgi:hypothetical protein
VRVLRLGESAQIADHHQDVLVDGVDVEEVVLHLADDAAEQPAGSAENAVLVHPPQLVRDRRAAAGGFAMKRARLAGSRRKAASTRLRLRHSARSVRADIPLSSGCRCIVRKLSSIAPGRRSNNCSSRYRAARRRPENPSSIGTARGDRGNSAGMHVLQQDDVDLRDRLRRAVVALHQVLAGALRRVSTDRSSRASAFCRSNTSRSSRRPAR